MHQKKFTLIKLQWLVPTLAIITISCGCASANHHAHDASADASGKIALIGDFLKYHKQIMVATYFGCNDIQEVARHTMAVNIYTKCVQIQKGDDSSTLDIHQIIPASVFRQVVILDADCSGGSVRRLLEKASIGSMFNESYHWLMLQDDILSSTISPSFLDTLNINLNSEIMWAILSAANRYNLYDVWNPGHVLGGKVNVTMVGSYSRTNGFKMSVRYPSSISRRMELKRLTIKCGAVIVSAIHEPYKYFLNSPHNSHEEGFNRHSYVLMQHIREIFNFKIRTIILPSWGYERNNTADGLISAIKSGLVEIGCAGLFVREYRLKYVSYVSTRGWTLRPTFIFRHPPSDAGVRNIFMQPFEKTVWLCILAAGVLYILLIKGINEVELKLITKSFLLRQRHASKSIKKVDTKTKSTFGIATQLPQQQRQHRRVAHELPTNGISGIWKVCLNSLSGYKSKLYNCAGIDRRSRCETKDDDDALQNLHSRWSFNASAASGVPNTVIDDKNYEEKYGLTLSFLVFLSAVCQQGATVNPKMPSSRCVLLSILIFGICMYQYYSASVVGALISEKPKTLKTLRQLTDSNLEIFVEDIAYNRDYLINTKDPIAQEMYHKKIQTVDKKTGNVTYNFLSAEDGLALVQNGGCAFHVDIATGYKIIADTFSEREVCDLAEIPLFRPEHMYFPVPHHSPFRKMVSYGMQRLTETGILRYRQNLYLKAAPQPKCVRMLQASDLKVNFNSISSAIIFLLVGYALSLTAFIGEVLHKRWRRLSYIP